MPVNVQLTREVFGNIDSLSRGVFYVVTILAMGCFFWGIRQRVQLWRKGRPSPVSIDWRQLRFHFGQWVWSGRGRLKDRLFAGWAHRFLFCGFLVLLIGTILIAFEHYGAMVFSQNGSVPLFHKGLYYVAYEVALDSFGLVFLLGVVMFAYRRCRGHDSVKYHWTDSVLLIGLILLGGTGFFVEAVRIIHERPAFPAVSYAGWCLSVVIEQLGISSEMAGTLHFVSWWFHALLALAFLAMIPYTRMLHVIAGMIQLVVHKPSLGVMDPLLMEEVDRTGRVGVGHIEEFTQLQLVQLDACVSCGRCQDACPAYALGTPLSPRNLVQELRLEMNRLQETNLSDTVSDERSEPEHIAETSGGIGSVSSEAIWSCTSCHACVDVCPLGVDPLTLISDMRRHLVGEGALRGSAAMALERMHRSGNPWGLPSEDRLEWARGLDVRQVTETDDFDVLYWVGCAAAYDPRIQKIARSVVQLLNRAQVRFVVLGPLERCTGESARRIGEEFLFQELAHTNLETLHSHRIRTILTHCPHCLNSFQNDYPQFGERFVVKHHTEYLQELMDEGKLTFPESSVRTTPHTVTYHDPCYLARVNGIVKAPRTLLDQVSSTTGQAIQELPRHGAQTACCGAGGGRMWFDDTSGTQRSDSRVDELLASGADSVAVACPFCMIMIRDGINAKGESVEVKDIAELLVESLTQSTGQE